MDAPPPADPIRWHDGMQLRVLVDGPSTSGRLALCALLAPPGSETSVHRHEHEDEVVYVRTGSLELWTRDEHRRIVAGESATLPRGAAHRLRADAAAGAELLIAFLPGGVEAALIAASTPDGEPPVDPDDLAALLSTAGIRTLPWERPPGLGT